MKKTFAHVIFALLMFICVWLNFWNIFTVLERGGSLLWLIFFLVPLSVACAVMFFFHVGCVIRGSDE